VRTELRRVETISPDDTPSVTAPSVVVDVIRFGERGGFAHERSAAPRSSGSSERLLFASWMEPTCGCGKLHAGTRAP
jgi:hypothetical protein